jgi:hypothetical protein
MIKLVDKLYTSTEVAQILGVSLRSVYRYIEESKLTAEVKTATGRHRFTRQDILDFLYPNGPAAEKEEKKEVAAPAVAEVPAQPAEVAEAAEVAESPEKPAEGEEESVDWLSKFREAASKFKEEEGKDGAEEGSEESPEKPAEEKVEQPAEAAEPKEAVAEEKPAEEAVAESPEEPAEAVEPKEAVAEGQPAEVPFVSKEEVKVVDEPAFSTEGVSGLADAKEVEKKPVEEKVEQPKEAVAEEKPAEESKEKVEEKPAEVKEEVSVASKPSSTTFFYRSSLGGLKDIAQNLDKNAREASLDYAFTLSSGLSLHKPIQPFSLLHSYVRTSDKEYFEKLLQLSPSDEEGSQLCLIISDEDKLYSDREEMHGLYVVSKEKLKVDVQSLGSEELKGEVEGILG